MMHYVVELLLWFLAVFLAGCILGYLLRVLRGRREIAEAVPAPVEMTTEPAPEPVSLPLVSAPDPAHMTRPKGLPEPKRRARKREPLN